MKKSIIHDYQHSKVSVK